MTAKKAATSAKHKTATKKHAASKKHTESKAQLAHLHVLHVEHTEHVAHMAAIGKPVTVKAKQPAHAKATKAAAFAVGDWLPVCSLEAVAMSLRLAGQRVHDDEVAGLWHLLGERPEGVPVGEALAAAALFGLAGCRPVRVEDMARAAAPVVVWPEPSDLEGASASAVRLDLSMPVIGGAEEYPVVTAAARKHALYGQSGHAGIEPGAPRGECLSGHGLILRIDVPGPHAVLATADGWWSWGELFSPWPCRVSEAWAVAW